tara:strand:- start:1080 stop:1352 length:273 start_codon:yes stop_codon:yes gene_type:complete
MNDEEKALELIGELFEYYKGDNWLKIKKFLVTYLHPQVRKNFSTRNSKTKKHTLNEFEKSLIKKCQNIYKRKIILYEKDKHNEVIENRRQ